MQTILCGSEELNLNQQNILFLITKDSEEKKLFKIIAKNIYIQKKSFKKETRISKHNKKDSTLCLAEQLTELLVGWLATNLLDYSWFQLAVAYRCIN